MKSGGRHLACEELLYRVLASLLSSRLRRLLRCAAPLRVTVRRSPGP